MQAMRLGIIIAIAGAMAITLILAFSQHNPAPTHLNATNQSINSSRARVLFFYLVNKSIAMKTYQMTYAAYFNYSYQPPTRADGSPIPNAVVKPTIKV